MRPVASLLLSCAAVGALPAEDAPKTEPPRPAEPPPGGLVAAGPGVVNDPDWQRHQETIRREIERTPQPVTVLGSDVLVDSPAVTLPDRFRYLAGVDVYQSRHGQYDVGLRGYDSLDNGRVLVQVDGRNFQTAAFGSVIWRGAMFPSDIAQVEIAKGPSSVRYGANAFGGAILIEGRDASAAASQRLYTLEMASDVGGREVDITQLGPLGDRFYYKVSAGGTWLDDLGGPKNPTPYQPNARTADSGDRDMLAHRYAVVAGYRIVDGWRTEVEYDGVDLEQWEFVDDLDVGSNATDWWLNTGSVRLVAPWGEARYIRGYDYYRYSNQKPVYNPAQDFLYAQIGFRDITDTARLQLNLPEWHDHQLTTGLEYTDIDSRSNLWSANGRFADRTTWASVSTDNRAAFAEDQWQLEHDLLFTGGLRIDDNSVAGSNVSPRAALNWLPRNDDPQAHEFWLLSYSRGYRLPTMLATYIQQYYFQNNPDLNVEKIQAVELGWQRWVLDGGLHLTANAFYNQSNDQVWILPLDSATMQANFNQWAVLPPAQQAQTGPGPFFQFRNLDDPVDVWGAESSAEWRVTGTPMTLWTNGTYQLYRHRRDVVYQSQGFNPGAGPNIFAFNRDLGREIDAPPRWKANLGARYESGPWFAGAALRYVDGRDIFSFANSDFQNGVVVTQHLRSYVAFDLSLGIDFSPPSRPRSRFLRLSLIDAFDSAHFEWYKASQAELTGQDEEQLSSEIGRSLVAQFGWEF